MATKNPGKAVLQDLYVQQKLSLVEIARRFEVTHGAVIKWLEAAGISRRPQGRPKGKPVSPEHLAKLRDNAAKARAKVTPEANKRGAQKRKGRDPWNKGGKWNDAQREKISAIRKTPEHRAKLSASKRGDKNGMWRGGTNHTDADIQTQEWKRRRLECYARDNWTCVDCGNNKWGKGRPRIQAHHVIPRRLGGGHELENLVTLCRSCHTKRENRGRDALIL